MMKKLALSLFKSADEKLRSLTQKASSSPKSNTYCGPQSFITDNFHIVPRSEPPDVPPPPVPKSLSIQSLPTQSNDPQRITDFVESTKAEEHSVDEEKTPPLLPRTLKPEMAERRVSQYNKRDADEKSAKRRSRSEGPHGRRRMRNSMHETSSTKTSQTKTDLPGRHSMYTANRSDEEVAANQSASDSAGSDNDFQKWTKNPLLVKRSRKSDRCSKVESRKSAHNLENGFSKESRGYSPSRNQKSKFQRMEANRRKRIEMTVTSDEECSPQIRISRLRQRAMMSSKLFEDDSSKNELNIVPQKNDNSFIAVKPGVNNEFRKSQYDERPQVQYSDQRHSKYEDIDQINNQNSRVYRQVPVQKQSERMKTNQIKLPDFIPVQHDAIKLPIQIQSANDSKQSDKPVRNVTETRENNRVKRDNVEISKNVNKNDISQSVIRLKMPSESPKLRSFQEVKPSKPAPMKKAVGKIELNQRSVNTSSDDSLDELIESNIQYLESEIESGKLKRQSGNFNNMAPNVDVIQRKVIREPIRKHSSIEDELKSRLHAPLSQSNPTLSPQVYIARVKSNESMDPTLVSTPSNTPKKQLDYRYMSTSGSATYSPHMKRKTYEYNEDMSKSDTQLNSFDSRFVQNQSYFPVPDSYVPYPVLNTQTGNIIYVQSEPGQGSNLENKSLSAPSMDSGMFSDVEYNIEVSERIKKWEKKITPAEMESKQRGILKTIQEYEAFSDSNHCDKSVPDTPVEIRRELRQLLSPTDKSGLGRLSVSLTRSTSSVSDSTTPEAGPPQIYFEPKVVSSETNLHRIFRVVHEPKSALVDRSVDLTPASSSTSVTNEASVVQRRRKHSVEQPNKKHTQSLGNMAHSESELGNSSQQTWPPMSVDSDSGIRKSWRMSRYEDEINELKELVADNFRDLRKKFDSDVSEPDSRRGSSPARLMTITPTETSTNKQEHINVPVVLNVQSVTPTTMRSPIVVRRARTKTQEKNQPPPVSPTCPPLTPKSTRKPLTISVGSRATPPLVKTEPKVEIKPPDVWSPSMESGKGLISIERVKARTLQTIPFSEDPVWKEIEDLTTFDKYEETPSKVNFDDIDALLELATKGTEKSFANKLPTSKPQNIMTTSFTPSLSGSDPFNTNQLKFRKLSDSALAMPEIERRKVFNPPEIQPLKLSAAHLRKSSTSALDDVLEDIRASLQKKPLSPKLLKNVDTTESSSSPNTSLRSPLTKSSKAFSFPKDTQSMKPDSLDTQKKESGTPGYDNTQPTWQQQQTITTMQQELAKQVADMPYVDPEFTQFPYIINGNYHLDPDLLSEKLINTGLVATHEPTPDYRPFEKRMALFQSKVSDGQKTNSIENTTKVTDSDKGKKDFAEMDQSVVELKNLAQEVEHKLSQIKTRIVSADEGKLDSILLALRKFAPTTEQKYFNVNFTPSYEPGKIKRGKLEDALTELEKIYESLNLQDKSLMDRASRAEEVPLIYRTSRQDKIERCNTRDNVTEISRPPKKTQHRKSHIDEVERQTQNEFEDITKSFQVLLDEVTKQCRSVARGSVNYSENEPMFTNSGGSMQYSTNPPANLIHHEPPRQQLKHGNQSQRDIQDSYNIAIKELESVATGQSSNFNLNSKPVQSSVYLNLDSMNAQDISMKGIGSKPDQKHRSNGLNIKLQSREKTINSDVDRTVSNNLVSVVTEFKPSLATSVNLSRDTSSSDSENVAEKSVTKRYSKQSNGKGRFRRKANLEHRKSMPALMKTVETQTIETQTDESLFEQSDKKGIKNIHHEVVKDLFTDLFREDVKGGPVKRKLSTGIAKMVDLFSSSEDEVGKGSKIKHSMSAPDIVSLFESLPIKPDKSDRYLAGNCVKPLTPKSVKNRHEAKSRFLSLQNNDANLKKISVSVKSSAATLLHNDPPSAQQDDVFDSPISKPPVYPVWQYPGQSENPSPKKADKRPNFGFDRDFQRNVSDTESDHVRQKVMKQETEKVRRRTRSDGNDEDKERPKSFHELMAAFESDPERLEKIRTSGLRKCASEESMFIDLVLQRMYSPTSFKENTSDRRPSDTTIKLSCDPKENN